MSKKEGIISTAHLVAPLELEGKDWHQKNCYFLLTSRWQHGPALKDRLSSWISLNLRDSELFSGHLVPWKWLMVLPSHCTSRVIEPAVFWRLHRDFQSLSLIEGAATLWTLYSFRDILEAFELCPERSFWQNVLKEGKKTITSIPKIWGTWTI